jgi:hypothetical protein
MRSVSVHSVAGARRTTTFTRPVLVEKSATGLELRFLGEHDHRRVASLARLECREPLRRVPRRCRQVEVCRADEPMRLPSATRVGGATPTPANTRGGPKVLCSSRAARDGRSTATDEPHAAKNVPPLPFTWPRNGVTWPPGPAWLSAPCSTYGLGGVATGLGALLDR